MNKSVELPIENCDLKVKVGTDGVWLHFGEYVCVHVANSLGGGTTVINSQLRKWILARQDQAKELI